MLRGFDVITVNSSNWLREIASVSTFAGFFPLKSCQNIVLVVSPLSSIIEDQISALNTIGISADVLSMVKSIDLRIFQSYSEH